MEELNGTNGLKEFPAFLILLLAAGNCCKLQETAGNDVYR